MATVLLKNVDKIYSRGVRALRGISLEVIDREFLVLVGPSGCGKSTALRIIAGLEDATTGEVWIGDRRVNGVSPKERDIAMVFQTYALYPHMDAYSNIGFGLKLRRLPKNEIDTRVREAARILNITGLLDKMPKALSGGERQRVALGRAIVRNPQVFLFDEPLSNLDAKLRAEMRAEISALHQRLLVTTVYVTHDQVEAMTMGERIAVMKDGVIQQIGDPLTIYREPRNRFVAEFIGSPPMNFLDADVTNQGSHLVAVGTSLAVPEKQHPILRGRSGGRVLLGVRPENVHIDPEGEHACRVTLVELTGGEAFVYGEVAGVAVTAKVPATRLKRGEEVQLHFDLEQAHFFDPETELRLGSGVDRLPDATSGSPVG
jgi:multiple sugar transport system ATP-binding protein